MIGAIRVVKLRGDGSDLTILEWYGAADAPLLLLNAQRDSVFGYFSIRAETALATGIRVQSMPVAANETASRRSTNNAFYDIVVDGADFGWRIVPGVGPDGFLADGNNEEHYFVECVVRDFSQAGWSIEHRQSKAHQFVQNVFDGLNVGRYGVATVFGSSLGSFHWLGGGGRRVTDAAFGLGGSGDVILIRDGEFPGTPALLFSGVSSGGWNVNLYRNHWSSFASSDRIINFLKAGLVFADLLNTLSEFD